MHGKYTENLKNAFPCIISLSRIAAIIGSGIPSTDQNVYLHEFASYFKHNESVITFL